LLSAFLLVGVLIFVFDTGFMSSCAATSGRTSDRLAPVSQSALNDFFPDGFMADSTPTSFTSTRESPRQVVVKQWLGGGRLLDNGTLALPARRDITLEVVHGVFLVFQALLNQEGFPLLRLQGLVQSIVEVIIDADNTLVFYGEEFWPVPPIKIGGIL
jgi:hypothetical protein